jgi:hypothetical protein
MICTGKDGHRPEKYVFKKAGFGVCSEVRNNLFRAIFTYISRKIETVDRFGKSTNRRLIFSRNEFRERMFHNPHHLKVSQPSVENLLDCLKEKTTFICFFLQLLGVKLSALSYVSSFTFLAGWV